MRLKQFQKLGADRTMIPFGLTSQGFITIIGAFFTQRVAMNWVSGKSNTLATNARRFY